MKKLLFYGFCFLLGAYLYKQYVGSNKIYPHLITQLEYNYGRDIDLICDELLMPSEYFKALVILESGGRKPSKSRFEQHVYEQLNAVKKGRRDKYNQLTQKDLKRFTDVEIRQLATSWGPIQVMGYHAILIGQPVSYFYGENALENSIKWCAEEYGHLLKKRDFRNAFHYHNTGKMHPGIFSQTHDPNYVQKGLSYLAAFQ